MYMAYYDKRIFDVTKGEPLPRLIHSFLSKRVSVAQEDLFHRRDFYIPISVSSNMQIKKQKKENFFREFRKLNEMHELLQLKNQGKRYVARVHNLDGLDIPPEANLL